MNIINVLKLLLFYNHNFIPVVFSTANTEEELSAVDARDLDNNDIISSMPNEIEIEVVSSANKVAVSVGGTQVRMIYKT